MTSCGGDDAAAGETVDCAFLEGAANCWLDVAAEISACLGGTGTFNAARTQCTYEDGSRVDLATAVPENDVPFDYDL